jgi:TPR repeat protein
MKKLPVVITIETGRRRSSSARRRPPHAPAVWSRSSVRVQSHPPSSAFNPPQPAPTRPHRAATSPSSAPRHPDALTDLAPSDLESERVERNLDPAEQLLLDAAGKDHAAAETNLGYLYATEAFNRVDDERAIS